jgi:hypothetical protein
VLTVGGQQKNQSSGKESCIAAAVRGPLFLFIWSCIKVDKKQAIKILIDSAHEYKSNFANKNMLIVFDDNNSYTYIETLFLPRHFLHLTGIETKEENRNASAFYKKCLSKKLSLSEFDFKSDGTTELKLSILLQMMNINNFSRMIGDYNNSKANLITEKIAGTTSLCMGFVKDGLYYVPNTALKQDARDLVGKTHRIVTVFSKASKDIKYCKLEYYAKKFNVDLVLKNETIEDLVNIPDAY